MLDGKTKSHSGLMTMTIYEAIRVDVIVSILSIRNGCCFILKMLMYKNLRRQKYKYAHLINTYTCFERLQARKIPRNHRGYVYTNPTLAGQVRNTANRARRERVHVNKLLSEQRRHTASSRDIDSTR